MADAWTATDSSLASCTAAVSSTKSLFETIDNIKSRNKTLLRLKDQVNMLIQALNSLAEVTISDQPLLILLESLTKLCSQACHEFEQAIKNSNKESKVDRRDWAKMKFRRGNMIDFIDDIVRYTSTIVIGLSITKLHASHTSFQTRKECCELIEDILSNLEIHLQRINEHMTQSAVESTGVSMAVEDEKEVDEQSLGFLRYWRHCFASDGKENTSAAGMFSSLEDREVTEDCLRVCKRAVVDIERFTNAEQKPSQPLKGLDENEIGFAELIGYCRKGPKPAVMKENPEYQDKISRLLSNMKTSELCSDDYTVTRDTPGLEVLKASGRNVFEAGEVIASGGSSQIVVDSEPGYFGIHKATSRGASAQLVASTKEGILSALVKKHYSS